MLTFIAEYPNDQNIRDGMMLRIKEIDLKYQHLNRIYLDISLFRKRKNNGTPTQVNDKLTIHHLNFFFDFFKIWSFVKKADHIYVQALYNYVKVLFFLNVVLKGKELALDLHGAIPEELSFHGSKLQSRFYSWVEKLAFKRVNHFVHVTHAMKAHFFNKYSHLKKAQSKDLVLGIFTSYEIQTDPSVLEKVKAKLNWAPNQVWIIYSGGTQQWQNVPLMLKKISENRSSNYRFLFLSGQYNPMCELVTEAGLENFVQVLSVAPAELKEYYSLAHYGLVLRDSDIVNKVSNPTKLSEYLAFGITPIVLDPRIGDYFEMGYEYIPLDEFNDSLLARKSLKNQEVYKKYLDGMNAIEVPFKK